MTAIPLINIDTGIYRVDETITAASLKVPAADADWSVTMNRLRGGLSDGIDVIRIDNGLLKLDLLATRGMSLWKGSLLNNPIGWDSPVKHPVHPSFVDEGRRGGIGWLDAFNEMIVRCGLGWNGAPGTDVQVDESGNEVGREFLPLHGRIANRPAHRVEFELGEDGALQITGYVDEASLFGGHLQLKSTLRTFPGSNTFELFDTVTNCGGQSTECELLYHCNFGPPFADAGSEVMVAASDIAPRDAEAAKGVSQWNAIAEPVTGFAEQVYFMKPLADSDDSFAVLKNQAADRAIGIRFDSKTLPHFSLWKNTQAVADGYCVGLEPATGFPNLRTFERSNDRVLTLGPDESVDFRLAISVATDSDTVQSWSDEVVRLQEQPATIHAAPRSDWSAT